MQFEPAGSAVAHFSYLLPTSYGLPFGDEYSVVVGIGAEIGVVMFDDDKPTITPESTPGIYNLAVCRRIYTIPLAAGDVDSFSAAGW